MTISLKKEQGDQYIISSSIILQNTLCIYQNYVVTACEKYRISKDIGMPTKILNIELAVGEKKTPNTKVYRQLVKI